jgi:competence protein ComGC
MSGFLVVLGIVAWVALAFWPATLAKKKGYSFILFLLIAIVISWLLALIITLFLKDKNETAQDRADNAAAEAAIERETGES